MPINYQDFRRLWLAALEIEDTDQYIAEEGGSIDCTDVSSALRLLRLIHRAARGTASDLRHVAQLTQSGMARAYGIPESTINKWDCGLSAPSGWTHTALAYALISDILSNDER